tara:strand:+ start:1085 stop:1990 length:906 start_codon:yes stop_codon:yes gene_type:complete
MLINLEKSFKKIQSLIIKNFKNLEDLHAAETSYDTWKRPEGGGGKTFVISNGNFFDNCAVNFSSIYGKRMPSSALGEKLIKKINHGYQAMGVSVISHPKNPYVPTSHMNVRLFGILDKNKKIKDWWIGGGYDLTPYISFSEDNISWHSSAKKTLDKYDISFYKTFSENCNNYFYIPHRSERRGIGGIFFDNLSSLSLDESLKMLNSIAFNYLESYLEIISKRKRTKYSTDEKEFQLIRRGRYAEFNLIYDRGTAFGLKSNGRIESILASLPTDVKWKYKKSNKYKIMEKNLLKNLNIDWNE